MPLQVPNLDDRRWADLVDEARSLIPRFAPRWTDHNVHDPGITFIELFAWLAEMQIYQLNRVGEKHREGFARLADVRRRPRTPARVSLVTTGTLTAPIVLPSGSQLAPLEVDDVVFETTEEIRLTRSRLLQVIVDDGTHPVDQTAANETFGIAFLAFGERTGANSELQLAFDRFYADESKLRLTVDVFTADLGARCGSEIPVEAAGQEGQNGLRPVELAWEYLGSNAQWLPLAGVVDRTAAFSRSDAVTFDVPANAAFMAGRVWLRARILRGSYDIEPRLRHIGVNGLPCTQIETILNELLGRSTGRPDQSFALAKEPVLIPDSSAPVRIEVAGEPWSYVESFDASGPASKEYSFDPKETRILFGNGLNGRIPPAGQEIRATWYQRSAGRSGNVAKELSWHLLNRVVPGLSVTNPDQATGGSDEESLNDMELRARAQLARPQRAVTLEDIERLALGTPHAYVARAKAIPDCPRPASITVVAVPKVRPGRTGPPARPSDAFLAAVRRHLQQRRLLCDNLQVVRPVYIEVSVSARFRLLKAAGPAAVVARARQVLDRFLAGEDQASLGEDAAAPSSLSPCPTRWPFGRPVFPSEVYAVLDRVAGVDSVSELLLTARKGGSLVQPDATGAIRLPRIGLVLAGAHDLRIDAGGNG
jgi:predicted phage baseplate assembly protein